MQMCLQSSFSNFAVFVLFCYIFSKKKEVAVKETQHPSPGSRHHYKKEKKIKTTYG